jgi:hypothetical protein
MNCRPLHDDVQSEFVAPFRPRRNLFINFVDPIFTAFVARLFTKLFDRGAAHEPRACLSRSGNAG